MGYLDMSRPAFAAISRMRATGPTNMGAINPAFAASTAPCNELSSQGCATAVGVGGSALQRLISRWYFVWLLTMVLFLALASMLHRSNDRRTVAN
jgi:hypothetical protein